MLKLETVNELALKVTSDGTSQDVLFTKAGAFICGESFGNKNYQFEKVLLGPQGNPLAAAMGQLTRRFTGENIPVVVAAKIMKKDQQFIRQGMIQGKLPIGSVLKKEKSSQYDYYISPFLFWQYTGYVYKGEEIEAG